MATRSTSDAARRRTLLAAGVGWVAGNALPAGATPRPAGTPVRIVSLYQGATDILAALGHPPMDVVESWTERPVYQYLRDRLNQPVMLGLETQPSLEDVVYLRPDLIVGSRFRNERIHPLLARIAPTVMLDDVYDFRAGMAAIGRAVGETARAESMLGQWRERAAALRGRLAAAYGARWPLTVSVLDFRDDHVRMYLNDSYSGLILADVGFARTPVQQGRGRVSEKLTSRESIPVADADVFFVLQRSRSAQVRQTMQRWRDHPLWHGLRAPRQAQVHEVDNVAWNLAGGFLSAHRVLDDIERAMLPRT